jgi:hypothetical protein
MVKHGKKNLTVLADRFSSLLVRSIERTISVPTEQQAPSRRGRHTKTPKIETQRGSESNPDLRARERPAASPKFMDDRLGNHTAVGELPDPRGYPRVAPDLTDETALQQDPIVGVQIQSGARGQVLVLEEVEHPLDPEIQNPALALPRSLIELAA